MATSKIERLMNLVIALLSTRQFLTAEKIRDSVAGYNDSANYEAFSRMFERDKNELRDLGVPLETGLAGRFSTVEGVSDQSQCLRASGRGPHQRGICCCRRRSAVVGVAGTDFGSPECTTQTPSGRRPGRPQKSVPPRSPRFRHALAVRSPRSASCLQRSTPAEQFIFSTAAH